MILKSVIDQKKGLNDKRARGLAQLLEPFAHWLPDMACEDVTLCFLLPAYLTKYVYVSARQRATSTSSDSASRRLR